MMPTVEVKLAGVAVATAFGLFFASRPQVRHANWATASVATAKEEKVSLPRGGSCCESPSPV